MIIFENNQFIINTGHTTYSFALRPSGHLEHLYYGPSADLRGGAEALVQKAAMQGGNGIAYSQEFPLLCLEDRCLEFSSYGHGDVREPFLRIEYPDGSCSSNFLYKGHRIVPGKTDMETLPASCAADEEGVCELHVLLQDEGRPLELELIYSVFPACDVITRRAVLTNAGEAVTIHRLMSLQLDFPDADFVFHTFTGAWAREMNRQQIPLHQGKWVNESRCGISSSMNNPFVMLSRPETSEYAGDCFAFNLVYSGSHYEAAEVNAYGKARIVTGLQPEGFAWRLQKGERFESPEAVMTFSAEGFDGISRHMHAFVREHIVRGEWKKKERPVLLNSWEAVYFDFNEEKLLQIAKTAREAGVELFVMDDGWFGERENDTCALGDWTVNREKLPGGISGLAKKIEALGMRFGLWVEPEMISVRSRLYEAHPDWAVDVAGQMHSEGRHQRILDLTRKEVRNWLVETMSGVFGEDGVSYVKWDNNRVFTDFFGKELERQGEFLHRYYMGLYEVMGRLTERFPHILFEGCASGGNRFDLGLLCYMPQIWASDNTDAVCRAVIQSGCSYGYPPSVIGAHVSACPNHQTGRMSSLDTRFGTAAFGVLGYECDLSALPQEELEAVKAQIAFYKKHRKTLQFGDFHRLVIRRDSDFERGAWQWITVAPDGSEAVGMYLQEMAVPNIFSGQFRSRGLAEDRKYRFRDWNPQGDAPEGTLGSEEDWTVSGGLLNHAGIKLMQALTQKKQRENMRTFCDGDSRIYLMEAEEEIHT